MSPNQRGHLSRVTFLLGRHATYGQDPPNEFRSTTAVRFPSLAVVHATNLTPVPLPRTRTSFLGVTHSIQLLSAAPNKCDVAEQIYVAEFTSTFIIEPDRRNRPCPSVLLRARHTSPLLSAVLRLI